MTRPAVSRSAEVIQAWLKAQVADLIGVEPDGVDVDQTFASFGLSSLAAVSLSGDLDEWLGIPLPATLAWDYPTISKLSERLANFSIEEESPVVPPLTAPTSEAIAIVGIACRFPGAADLDAFWDLLCAGTDAVTEVPADRWPLDAFYDETLEDTGKMNTRCGSFLPGIDRFDPSFFGIPQREADAMDPQQRLLLEVSWEALEHAGIPAERISDSQTGVFVAINGTDFYKLLQGPPPRAGTGVANCIGANRLSYFYNLHGPSLAVDTACSSSLVAVHLACQSLRTHEVPLAMVGAVNLTLLPEVTVSLSQAAMMAPDGRCKTFDASADGYVRGEGCAVLILKRLSDSQRDGDRLLGIIRGSAVNQDGRSNGLTAPSGLAQQAVIRQALASAGVRPAAIAYVEAHGSGTPLGDPIEVQALSAVLSEGRSPQQPKCWLGAVKTNLGHLEAAAGMAGLIKAVMVLRYGLVPPNLHFVEPNPELKLETTPFALPLTLTPLLETGHGRFAGVSSFGYGGTNSHVILEAPPPAPSVEPPARIHHVLTLSARNDEALRELAGRYRDRLEGVDAPTLAALCHAANTRRSRLGHRLALAVGDAGDMAAGLTAYVAGEPWARLRTGSGNAAPAIAFMFTGQGTRIGPGIRFLYDRYAVFRTVIERCSQILAGELDQPLAEILFSADPTRLQPTAVAQPVLFAVEAALADLWQSFGVVPTAVLGHSLGEYVAAYVAGVFSLEDGLRLVTARGKMMQALPPGGQMIAVFEEPEVVKRAIAGREDRLSIAAINGDRHTVLSGDRTAVEAVLAELGEDTLTSEPFTVSHAFHSPLMAPMCEGFAAIAREVSYQAPRLPMGSNELGDFLPADALPDADHWVRHVREPVRFVGNVLAASQLPVGLFLEVGPDAILTGMARRLLPKESLCVPSLKVDAEEATFAEAMATLSAAGIPLDGHAIDGEAAWPHTKLPRYPFQRHRCWLSPEEIRTFATEGSTP